MPKTAKKTTKKPAKKVTAAPKKAAAKKPVAKKAPAPKKAAGSSLVKKVKAAIEKVKGGAKKVAAPAPKAAPAKATAKKVAVAKGAKAPVAAAKPAKEVPAKKAKVTAATAKPAAKGAKTIPAPATAKGKGKKTEKELLEEDLGPDFSYEEEFAAAEGAEGDWEAAAADSDDVVLTDADGNPYCKVKDCDQLSKVDGYCRYHYIALWKRIQTRKKILAGGKLDRYIEELTARYPDKYLEMLRKDLASEKDFLAVVAELDIDDNLDGDMEDDSQAYIEEMRGVVGGEEGGSDEF
jgi:hypothetical protein